MGKTLGKVYFCWQAAKEEFNYKGDSLGMGEELAIYYCRAIGRRRNYRQSYPVPMYKGLALKTFKSKKNAQELCDYTNKEFGNSFVVVEKVMYRDGETDD